MAGHSVLGHGGDLLSSDGIDDTEVVALLIGYKQRWVRGGHLSDGGGAEGGEQKER